MRRKKIFSTIMSIVLVVGLMPSLAFASEQNSEAEEKDVAASVEQPTDKQAKEDLVDSAAVEEPLPDSVLPQESNASSDASMQSEDNEIALYSVIGSQYVYDIDYQQVDESTKVQISLPNYQGLMSSGRADSVTVTAQMQYSGVVTRSASVTVSLEDVADPGALAVMDLGDYGKFSVSADFYKNGTLVHSGDAQTLGIVASEYNIAPVSATLPVTFFSLSLFGSNNIRYNSDGGIVPTIVMMERPSSWNWNSLPEGVYGLPYLSIDELTYQPASFGDASNLFRSHIGAMDQYVKDLYELNPSSKFNLYLVDYYLGIIQSSLYANGIPQNQYTVTVLSDGSFSYNKFGSVYSSSDPAATDVQLQSEWNSAKQYAYDTGSVKSGFQSWMSSSYLYAVLGCESNIQWWLARPALLESGADGNVFGKAAQSNAKVVRFYIDRALKDLQTTGGDAAVSEFKAMYNFSDSYFADAEKAGKDVMLFLGTTVGNEGGTFGDYARFAMTFYGDKYAYYYKGHPGTPTDMYPEKQAELDALGIKDVDSSIAAELILFFYPDIYLSGYQSSTYASLQDASRAKGMFNTSKAQGMQNESYAVMDWFMTPVGDNTDASIRQLCSNHKSYLIEFNDEYLKSVDYTIAIWDNEAGSISFYKQGDSGYELVRVQNGDTQQSDVKTIAPSFNRDKSIDISSASMSSGANAQIWSNNRSIAQRFNFIKQGDYYIVQSVNSGKVLDVSGAASYSGANVQQYDRNNSAAQLWSVIDNGDGTVSMQSVCNGLFLDVSGAGDYDGANLQVWEGNGSAAQKFYLNGDFQTVANGTYRIASKVATESKVLDITGAGLDAGVNLQLWESNGTAAQAFNLNYDSSTGYYSLANSNSNKVLDVQWASADLGANVWQYDDNGSTCQKWSVERNDDGTFSLYTAMGTGYCLDVDGAQSSNGTNVQMWESNGTNAQKWELLVA